MSGILYNNDFVTTSSRVTPDGKYPDWYLPPGYRVAFDPNSQQDKDLMAEKPDHCFFASTEQYMTWGMLPTSDTNDGSLASLGRATLDYFGNEDVFVYMAKFKWEGSSERSLPWLRDVYQFSNDVIDGNDSQAIVDNSMAYAFYGAKIEQVWAFDDTNTVNNFTISNQDSLRATFADCDLFDQELSWDTSNVTDMNSMFRSATAFNQPVNFDTSDVTDMSYMFYECRNFNQPVNFDTREVTDMNNMFSEATVFDQSVDFDTREVTDMKLMFSGASAFNQSLDSFNTSEVTDMSRMFSNARAFDQSLDFNTSKVTDMRGMFFAALAFNQDIGDWDTSDVVANGMDEMFYNAAAFDQDLSNWCVSQILSKPFRFDPNSGFENQPWKQPRWGVGCALGNRDDAKHYFVSSSNTIVAESMPAFEQTVSDLTYLGPTNGGYLYSATFDWNNDFGAAGPERLTWLVDVRQFGGNKLGNGLRAFQEMPAAQLTALPDLDTSNLTDMYGMFFRAGSFNQSLDNFDTSNVTRMGFMFVRAYAFNQSLDSFDTSNVSDMGAMFAYASVFNQDISDWCVQQIATKPSSFDVYSGFQGQTDKQPQWGDPC